MASRRHEIAKKIVKFLRNGGFATLVQINDIFVLDGSDSRSWDRSDALNSLYKGGDIKLRTRGQGPFVSNINSVVVYLELTPKGRTTKRYGK